MLAGAARERLAWVLAALLLPDLRRLRRLLDLPADAAARRVRPQPPPTPASAPPASWCSPPLLRPVGGWLSDRIGGARVLAGVFLGVVPVRAAARLAVDAAVHGRRARLRGAAGARQRRGVQAGAASTSRTRPAPSPAWSARMGGLGGFFPPLLLGVFRDRLGAIWPGLRAARRSRRSRCSGRSTAACSCRAQEARELDAACRAARAAPTGCAPAPGPPCWTALLVAAIVVGSRNLQNFDAALVIYTFAVIFATWGVAYHYAVWLQKPPTRIYWRRGWQLVREPRVAAQSPASCSLTPAPTSSRQTFIRQRSRLRWWMHQLLFWGCLLAVAITFPLVFGWIHFGTRRAGDQMTYVTYVFGFPTCSLPRPHASSPGCSSTASTSPRCWCSAGIALALWRRMRDRGRAARAVLRPRLLPADPAVRDLGDRPRAHRLHARGCAAASTASSSILHAITVIAGAALPARSASSSTSSSGRRSSASSSTRSAGARARAPSARAAASASPRGCTSTTSTARARELGFDYRMPRTAPRHWQELCPPCKRKIARDSRSCALQGGGRRG